ncbi:four-carbon acid sugar kinase family protein [Halosimplex sp. TS25]|uniref:four-carbon acid sugar kinase family protein n=1 Tax=Halosimplex rarum TaxID=3396619 RepID=UPI0039EAC459
MPSALVVADDLTGAMDTGHGFAARGRSVRVRRAVGGDPSDTGHADVLVVDTDSRDDDPAAAATAVARAVDAHPAELVYKKVDSTLRGNVVAEVDAAVAAARADLAVVAPAFPATGRTTEGGRHLVDGTPLAEAGYGASESALRTLFAPSDYPAARVESPTVEAGADAVADRLTAIASSNRPALAICDAATDDHLAAIADGAASTGPNALYVGSGGLAARVAVPGESPAAADPRADSSGESGVLGVVGSVNERTLAQLAPVDDAVVVTLDPAAAVRDPETVGRAAADALTDSLGRRGRAVVTAATGADDVRVAERGAADVDAVAADRIATALAAAARATVDGAALGGLFLTGGDVAGSVLDALDAAELALAGESVADGVPVGQITAGPAAGTRVVTKAGGFGDRRVILNCLDAVGA